MHRRQDLHGPRQEHRPRRELALDRRRRHELLHGQRLVDESARPGADDERRLLERSRAPVRRCPDPTTCASHCALEGADYEGTYGIHAAGDELQLDFVTHGSYGDNVGSRVYLLDGEDKYHLFKLKNREFSVTIDDSALGCGLNGALYFVGMSEDGDAGKGANTAGAKYGTGYCDAQCPHDIKFIDGEANILDWDGTSSNSGTGRYGTCCIEMDVWEGNRVSNAVTPHACSVQGQYRCDGEACGDGHGDARSKGVCDKDGCDFAPYRLGATQFFGEGSGFAVDTSKKFTVVTQFLTTDGTDEGDLSEIRRFFLQDGAVVPDPTVTVGGDTFDRLSDGFCAAQKQAFGDENTFEARGGLAAVGDQMDAGMVLVMSLWDDHDVDMLWLDSTYPANATGPGAARGSCGTDSGEPADVEANQADAYVTFSAIKVGTINSTFAPPTGHVCKKAGCNVCAACCQDYIGDCDACVAAQCGAAGGPAFATF